MPRIYAANEAYTNNWASVPADNGVLALPVGTDTSWFTANGFTVDNSKHALTLLDDLTPAQLRQFCAYIGLTIDQGEDPDTKQALVRAIETSVSTKYITALTVTSTAGTEVGDSNIAITDPGAYAYKYKTAQTTAPTLLFMDYPNSTWLDIESGEDITPASGHDKITVIRLNAAGYVIGIGSDDITVNAG